MRKITIFILVLALFSACSKEEEKTRNPREDNILIKAIRTPMDKASGAKDKTDERIDAIDSMYDDLADEEGGEDENINYAEQF